MKAKGTLLIVDDDPMIRTGLQRILGGHGYTVEQAASVEEALTILSRRFFDLVMTDLQMPGQDGMALLQEVKRRSAQTPVVMLTGHGSMDVVIQAMRNGASDFLNKPYKPDELLTIVDREVARHRQSLPPGVQEGMGLQLAPDDFDEIERLLLNLRMEINARSVMLIAGNGSVIAAKGIVEDVNISALGALVAGDFAATAGIASLIGEEDAFKLNFHEGAQYSVYSGQVAAGVYLLVIFGQDIRLGAVLFYTKETLAKLHVLISKALIHPVPTPETPVPTFAAEASPEVAVNSPSPEPAVTDTATETQTETEPQPLFSFDELLNSGALAPDVLEALESQFANLWESS